MNKIRKLPRSQTIPLAFYQIRLRDISRYVDFGDVYTYHKIKVFGKTIQFRKHSNRS